MRATGATNRHKVVATLVVSMVSSIAASFPAAVPGYQDGFPITLNGTRIRNASIALGDLDGDGVDDMVIGGTDGKVYAYRGNGTLLWIYDTGSMAIEGKAAIADIDGDSNPEVIIGAGSATTPSAHGGLYVIDHTGALQCDFESYDSNNDGWREGVYSSPAVADLVPGDSGRLEIAFGGWDRRVWVINDDCTVAWEFYDNDAVWSSPAIGDINQDGQLDVIIGTAADSEHDNEQDGGMLRVFDGASGVELDGFPIQTDEVIWSSPTIGDINDDGFHEIFVGTGNCWSSSSCAGNRYIPGVGRYLNAWDHTGQALPGWPVMLPDTYAFAAPTLADLDEDGEMEIIINTLHPDDSEAGQIYVLNADGSFVQGWPTRPTTPFSTTEVAHFSTKASPIIADLTGDGHLEVIIPSSWELTVFDRNGNQLSRDVSPPAADDLQLRTSYILSGTAAVGDVDGDGDLEVVVGGGNTGGGTGVLYAWDFATAADNIPWATFRKVASNSSAVALDNFSDDFESGDLGVWTVVQ